MSFTDAPLMYSHRDRKVYILVLLIILIKLGHALKESIGV